MGVCKLLILISILCVTFGLLWPLLAKLGLGNLRGDIRIERTGYTFYFPLTSSIIVSIIISLILWILRR